MDQDTLTAAAIRDRVGERSFSRGRQYFQAGAVVDPRREGGTLRAGCWGSAPRPYQLWVQLGADGLLAADCSCPVGDGGYCKHMAALLLAWLHTPEAFAERENLEAQLDRRDKADLILLIRQMLARYPDLEELVDLFPAGSSGAATNPALIRRQVEYVLRNVDDDPDSYGGGDDVAAQLESILRQAEPFRRRGAWAGAAAVYGAILDAVRERHAETYGHDGALSHVLWQGSLRLGECLTQIAEPEARQVLIRRLVEIVLDDIALGGYGFGDGAYEIIMEQTTAAEKAACVSQVEAELEETAPDDFSSAWRQAAFGGLLLDLQAETLTDEHYLALCRRTGRLADLVQRLLQLERVAEAAAAAAEANDYTLLALADIFVAAGQAQIAEELVWERTASSSDARLETWLQQRALAAGDWQQAAVYAENLFRRDPRLEGYGAIRDIAARLGDWPARRQSLLAALTGQQQFALLTRIHLLEGDVPAALATLPQVRYNGVLAMEVALAAEAEQPREALRLYRAEIDRLIAARGRGNYAAAADYLVRVRDLYARLEEANLWQEYITTIRKHQPRLPALLDELRRAGL